MRLRITKIMDGATTVLCVDGELLGEGCGELDRVAHMVEPLRLDLSSLLRVDAQGLAALRRYAAAGAELVDVAPYIALLLDRAADGD